MNNSASDSVSDTKNNSDETLSREKAISLAKDAREYAQAPYSNFKVGAALEDCKGNIHTGCNIENATYSLSTCAERVALVKAVSNGIKDFRRIVVVADTDNLTPPCGSCRQLLWEFCGNAELVLANLKGTSEIMHVGDIFPRAFDKSFL